MGYFFKENTYEDRTYKWLKRKGLADKYEHAGIYCIKIDDQIVYIGKSRNMLRRITEHYVGIKRESEKKYRIIAEAQRKGHAIAFDVLYYSKGGTEFQIHEDIGRKEGELIRQYMPLLNHQIPKEEDWHKFDVKKLDAEEIRKQLLGKEEVKNEVKSTD